MSIRSQPIWLDEGLITEYPLRKAPPGVLLEADNVIYRRGYWEKRPGFNYYGVQTLANIVTMVASFRQETQTYLVLCDNTKFYWYVPDTDEMFDITGDALTATAGELPDYTTFGDYLIVTNGYDDTQRWAGHSGQVTWLTHGGTWSAATHPWNDATLVAKFEDLPNAYKARFCQSFMGRLFLFDIEISGDRERTAGAWSSYRDPTDWISYDSDTFYLDDNPEPITGVGLCKEFLIVFKRRSVYAVSFIGGVTLFEIIRKSDELGTIGHGSIQSGEDRIFFVGEEGGYTYDMYNFREFTAGIKTKFVQSLHPEYKTRMHSTLDHARNLYILYYCSIASTGIPDKALVYDYQNEKVSLWTLPAPFSASGAFQESGYSTWADMGHSWVSQAGSWYEQAWIKEAENYLTAEYVGGTTKLRKMGSEMSDAGVPFTSRIRTAYFGASQETDKVKQLARVGLYARRNGATLQVTHGRCDDGHNIWWNATVEKQLTAGEEDHFVDLFYQARFHVIELVNDAAEDAAIAGMMLEVEE